ncbi:MAG: methionine synthase [Elusimicrobiota bacterium]|jgi:5-methyltetrahydrofolate--homocysteine methyltransferase
MPPKKKTSKADRGRLEELQKLLGTRILVLDGAMGTELQTKGLKAADFGGPELEGCNEHLVLTRKDVIASIHESYLQAGADIIETNTFGAVPWVLEEYGISAKASEINRAAVELALKCAKKHSTPRQPRFVAGSMGPGTKTISVTGGITFGQVREGAKAWATDLVDAGCDLLLIETQQDTLNLKAALAGADDAFAALGRSVPVMVSVSIESSGTMLGGQTIEALYASLAHRDLLALGMNCATGAAFMTDHLRTLSGMCRFPTLAYPNAGMPDENGKYSDSPAALAKYIERFCSQGWVNIVGGCCGTTPAHIRLMAAMAAGTPPRQPSRKRPSMIAGLEALALEDKNRPVLVGERANVLGSKAFKELIVKGAFEEAAETGRAQVKSGAQILDVCLSNPEREEKADVTAFLGHLLKKVRAPIMIDSTDPAVMEAALELCPGKCVINSVNLEDGEAKLASVAALARRHGAALVVGAIDEDKAAGMALTRERKLAVCQRAHDILVKKHGMPAEDLFFDSLVFPAASGDKNYWGSAVETIEGIRLIKKALPKSKTILGVSNVSFGLPLAGREVLNAVFLYQCVQAGLDCAIVNASKLARYSTLPEADRKLAEALLTWKGPGDPAFPPGSDPLAEFAARFKAAPTGPAAPPAADLPAEERLERCVLEGSKQGLPEAVAELLGRMKPLEIVNGPLMKGMAEVGRRFAANELIVAEVLQSAEAMKAAVTLLEPHMEKGDSASRGKFLLATVKGDVHEIGKNLVHIILKNNGFEIVDLGIKVPPETLVAGVREHKPDAIGLSGLLVKSAEQMALTAEDLSHAGIDVPLLIGGAALSQKFTSMKIAPRYKGPVFFCRDAMKGLAVMSGLSDPAKRESMLASAKASSETSADASLAGSTAALAGPSVGPAAPAGPAKTPAPSIPAPRDLTLHLASDVSVSQIFPYINPVMLYGKHLGLKSVEKSFADNEPKAMELKAKVEALQAEVAAKGIIKPRGVYRFFAAHSDGDSIILYENATGKRVVETFTFPRQTGGERRCIADWVAPATSGKMDYVALFAVTCGHGVAALSEKWRAAGDYVRSHALQALAIESAEGFAELLHERLRAIWGISDAPDLTMRDKFQAKYQGLRVSFGYPACPRIEDQRKLFALIDPANNAGITLTDGCMMEPEASVSALVFHHPAARYFAAGSPETQAVAG